MKVIIPFIAVLMFLTGCYTVIKHPALTDSEDPQYEHPVYYNDDCSSCHADKTMDISPAPQTNYLPRLNYIYDNSRWNDYYSTPWWYRDMFYQSGGGHGGTVTSGDNGTLPTTSARRRFPGAGGSNSGSGTMNNTSISGSTSGGTRITGSKSNTSQGNASAGAVRQQQDNNGARKAIRGSGNSKSDSKDTSKVNRREKK